MPRAVIIGGGHNGLACGTYLTKEGIDVTVLESREMVGGATVTEELWPGFRISRFSYVVSLLPEKIIQDLELHAHGYNVLERNPSGLSLFPNDEFLVFYGDEHRLHEQISKFSPRDADAFGEYEDNLAEIGRDLEATLLRPPANLSTWWTAGVSAFRDRALWKHRFGLTDLMGMSASEYLNQFFESEAIKSTLATDGVIGAWAGPMDQGTGYVLLHHVMGGVNGKAGVWGFVEGGMGGISGALLSSGQANGLEVRTNATAKRIIPYGSRYMITLDDGGSEIADAVICAAAPKVLCDLISMGHEYDSRVQGTSHLSGSAKINLALSGLPEFTCQPPAEALRGTIHISPTVQYIQDAFDEAKVYGHSRKPMIEMTIPSIVDPSVAPEGKQVMNIFVQYLPYDSHHQKEAFYDAVIDAIEQHAPRFRESILHHEILSPKDIEEITRMPGGNLFHGAMNIANLGPSRPVPGFADYTTPSEGIFLAGSGAHPGGGATCIPGHNGAKKALQYLKKR